jgi:hypothetical protein
VPSVGGNLWRPLASRAGLRDGGSVSREVGALLGTIEEPVSPPDLTLLRHLVVEHKATERRHRFPAILHLGGPGRPEVGRIVEWDADLDHALRCDVLEAMLRRPAGPLMTWLTRPGGLEPQDVDLAWLRVVVAVNGETGRSLPFVVVTREGWRDPRLGVGRTWRRLRVR